MSATKRATGISISKSTVISSALTIVWNSKARNLREICEIAKELLCGSVLADRKVTDVKTDENTVRVTVTMEFIENIGEPIIKNKLRNLWNNLDENKYSVKDLEQKTKEELIEIIRGACDVKD